MSIGEFVDWHVGRYVGIPQTAIYNWRTRLINFSLSLGRLVGHVKTILDFVVDGRGRGLVFRKTSVPLIVSPWLYKACKYNYEFSLWHG